jgi:hypothetical protein
VRRATNAEFMELRATQTELVIQMVKAQCTHPADLALLLALAYINFRFVRCPQKRPDHRPTKNETMPAADNATCRARSIMGIALS